METKCINRSLIGRKNNEYYSISWSIGRKGSKTGGSVLKAGGQVTGVEPQFFMDKELLTHMIDMGLSSEERQKGINGSQTFGIMI